MEDHCSIADVPTGKRPSLIRKIASGCVFWIGMALIGILAIPIGILACILYLIATVTGFLTDKLDKE